MNAKLLARRIALDALITHDLEEVEPTGIDPDLLVGDDDLDVLQCEAEQEFVREVTITRQRRSNRFSRQSW